MGGRTFQGMCPVRFLHSDSSDQVWAGLDTTINTAVQDFWRDKSVFHINVKELRAAVHPIKSLGKPKEHIHLSVDNSVAVAYLRRWADSPTSTTSWETCGVGVWQKNCSSPCAGKIIRGKGRFSHQTSQGLWGLYSPLRNLSTHTSKALALGSTNNGLLCHPQKHQVPPFLFSSAS